MTFFPEKVMTTLENIDFGPGSSVVCETQYNDNIAEVSQRMNQKSESHLELNNLVEDHSNQI